MTLKQGKNELAVCFVIPVPYRITENAPILKMYFLLGSQLSCLQMLFYAILQNSDFKTGF